MSTQQKNTVSKRVMTRIYAYKDRKFTVKAELNYKIAKRTSGVNGEEYIHLLIINDNTSDWVMSLESNADNLSVVLLHLYTQAENYTNSFNTDSQAENFLSTCGFS
jgi:hypothetical protein